MTRTPAGWYADPDTAASPGSLRYWDGAAWTSHVHAVPVRTGPTTPDGEPLAGWWWRVLAWVIDGVILNVVAGLASLPGFLRVQSDLQPVVERFIEQIDRNREEPPDMASFYGDYFEALQGSLQENGFWLVVPTIVITTFYWTVFLRWKGGTPGKLMLGMRVRLRSQPGAPPLSSIAARLLVQFGIVWTAWVAAMLAGSAALFVLASVVGFVMLIDPLWAAWDPNRQALHDKLAGTNVVRHP